MKYNQYIAAGLLLGMLPTVAVFAQTDEAEKRMMRPATAFSCDSISVMEANVLSRVSERGDAVMGNKLNRRTERAGQKSARLAALESKRNEKESLREARYSKMRDHAKTEEQKEAVETFIKTVERLVGERKAAVDAAVATFETDVMALRDQQDVTAESVVADVSQSVRSVFDDARAACSTASDGAAVREIISAGMKNIQSEHQARRAEYTYREEFEALRAKRQQAERAALATFTTEMKAATDVLKASLSY